MAKHLAIISKQAIEQIIKGKKTIESRFSQKKIVPFGVVHPNDTVYFKEPGKDICGQFSVKKVISFENIDEEDWGTVIKFYGKRISLSIKDLDVKFFEAHKKSKFGTLIFINSVEQLITAPFSIKKKDQRGWVVLED